MSAAEKNLLFYPKFISLLKEYKKEWLFQDLTSGLIVGIVALPLAIAFGIASGVTPDRSLITAIVAGFLISLLGGSRLQIGGPTGAFVVIVYGIVEQYGIDGLLISTFLAGMILICMGLFRLGSVIHFIPYPMVVGFTSGIAVVIFSSQVRDFLGLNTGVLPGDFLEKWGVLLLHMNSIQWPTLFISLLSMTILLLWPKINKRIPGSIIAIILTTFLVYFFQIPVATIASRFGELPTQLPSPGLPLMHWVDLQKLISPAFTIAMLGAIESLLSATVADGMTGTRHRSNTELIGQGIANLVTPLFGGIPATGAIARTVTNIKNGGKTPLAGMFHAIVLLLILSFFGEWVGLIPIPALAAILVMVSFHMSEWRTFKSLLKSPKMDVAVLLVTFFLTVLIDLTVAVEVGLILSALLFMKRMTDVTNIRQVTHALQREEEKLSPEKLPPGVEVLEAEGAFFFGVAELVRDTLNIAQIPPKVLILHMRHVLALDATGIQSLRDLHKKCEKYGTALILSGIHSQPLEALKNGGLIEQLGSENVTSNLSAALKQAEYLATGR